MTNKERRRLYVLHLLYPDGRLLDARHGSPMVNDIRQRIVPVPIKCADFDWLYNQGLIDAMPNTDGWWLLNKAGRSLIEEAPPAPAPPPPSKPGLWVGARVRVTDTESLYHGAEGIITSRDHPFDGWLVLVTPGDSEKIVRFDTADLEVL